MKFEKSTERLELIIEIHRPPQIRTSLGFTKRQKDKNKQQLERPIEISTKEKGSKSTKAKQSISIEKRKKTKNRLIQVQKRNTRFGRQAPKGQRLNARFNYSFSSYCFNCKNFGHKTMDCTRGPIKRNKKKYVCSII